MLHINNIEVSKITTITNAMVNNNSLEELNLNVNKLNIRIIRTLRHHNNTITKFELINIPVSFYSHVIDINKNSRFPYQMEFFLSCTQSLHSKWNFSKCHIGYRGMSILHECLCRDKASKQEILEINLNENYLTWISSPLIADIISHLKVHTLLLCNNITDVREISTAVITSSTLKVLSLNNNGITAENAKVISDMMICLEELYISSKRLYNRQPSINCSTNKLSDQGAELLSNGITNTKTQS